MKRIFVLILVCTTADRFSIWCEAKCFYEYEGSPSTVKDGKCFCMTQVDLKEIAFKLNFKGGALRTKKEPSFLD
jgi:hypothetical protein